MQNSLHARQVDFRVFGKWMVAMNQQGSSREETESEDSLPSRWSGNAQAVWWLVAPSLP